MAFLQNSGLGNTINPLTSLLLAYEIPCLMVVTWRGEPSQPDAAQHRLMGAITPRLLELVGVDYEILSSGDDDRMGFVLDRAETALAQRKCFALLVRKGAFEPFPLAATVDYRRDRDFRAELVPGPRGRAPFRRELFDVLVPASENAVLVSSTGHASRDLCATADRESHFYMQGSMGFAAALGLGISLFHRGRVIVVDGDGSLLMRMGGIFTVGAFHRGNLTYLLLDNAAHDSTGGQSTISPNVRFDRLADAAGFDCYREIASPSDLRQALGEALPSTRLSFLHCRIGSDRAQASERPELPPPELAARLRAFTRGDNP